MSSLKIEAIWQSLRSKLHLLNFSHLKALKSSISSDTFVCSPQKSPIMYLIVVTDPSNFWSPSIWAQLSRKFSVKYFNLGLDFLVAHTTIPTHHVMSIAFIKWTYPLHLGIFSFHKKKEEHDEDKDDEKEKKVEFSILYSFNRNSILRKC